jgi:methylmalonyl-CoA mutase N-terminal domain/subunit
VLVGVNQYVDETRSSPPLLRIDPEIERTQVERLAALRARRDAARAESTLRAVEETARTERNLLPAILDAVKAYATVGEISDALRRVFGEYQESVVI